MTPVVRLRPRLTADPYAGTTAPDWTQPSDDVALARAFVASASSVQNRDANRTQLLTAKSLYCDPADDVQPLDRIRADGVTYTVTAVPAADTNPFTGWQPVQEIPLEEVRG